MKNLLVGLGLVCAVAQAWADEAAFDAAAAETRTVPGEALDGLATASLDGTVGEALVHSPDAALSRKHRDIPLRAGDARPLSTPAPSVPPYDPAAVRASFSLR
ncbi:hypothetical protein EV683_103162 [Crenobacter luteus]|uniref:Uncharacterized protein n=1 Tax=Crenobacter luteus TaxID=1452487 RepID=A0A163CMV3_9NEIS|nr:hypothetical protein [Crenobacter luteus]KZE32817.1 hypothetical protein AVW16_10550 [Crenobacter luteus]TCP14898.1 hypothetical protein EV683_103162 [Crenobacter luteus]